MEEAFASVTAEMRKKVQEWQKQESLWSVLSGFAHAIDWQEPWIVTVLAFQVVMLLTALFTRKWENVQLAVFFIAMAVILSAESLNQLGRRHWKSFSGQNYFDESGVFMSAVVSGPLLMTMFILLLNYLWSCFNLMVIAKRKELLYKQKQKKRQEGLAHIPGDSSRGLANRGVPDSKKAE